MKNNLLKQKSELLEKERFANSNTIMLDFEELKVKYKILEVLIDIRDLLNENYETK